MMLLNVAVCEDEEMELKRMMELLDRSECEMNRFVYRNAADLIRDFEPRKFDIILMDIYMPQMTGVEAVEQIREKDKDVYIAFCTTSVEHAIDGYRLNVERYLEKPVRYEELLEVLMRASSRRMTVKRRCISMGKNAESVMFEDVVFMEQKNHTVYFHLSNGETVHKTDSLDAIMKTVDAANFCHCHKSYVVNFDYVESVEPELFVFKMRQGGNVQIKQRDFPKIRDRFNEYMFSQLRREMGGNESYD